MKSANNNYIVRQAEKGDSKRVWQIRNHPLIRKYSNNPESIVLEKHQQWFEDKYFKGQPNYCFVLESRQAMEQGKTIGYCRFDLTPSNNFSERKIAAKQHLTGVNKQNNAYVISIALDVDFQGRGLGSFLLSASLKKVKSDKSVLAEVKKDNMPGLKLFKKNNFEIISQDQERYYLQHQH